MSFPARLRSGIDGTQCYWMMIKGVRAEMNQAFESFENFQSFFKVKKLEDGDELMQSFVTLLSNRFLVIF
ncbi:unnamed protein product [Lathyrus oleraceus]